MVIFLDNYKNMLGIEVINTGNIKSTAVTPLEVLKPALQANAASIIIAHNHPSGSLQPSSEDLEITENIIYAGRRMGLLVRDHIIIGKSGYFSFKEKGLI